MNIPKSIELAIAGIPYLLLKMFVKKESAKMESLTNTVLSNKRYSDLSIDENNSAKILLIVSIII